MEIRSSYRLRRTTSFFVFKWKIRDIYKDYNKEECNKARWEDQTGNQGKESGERNS